MRTYIYNTCVYWQQNRLFDLGHSTLHNLRQSSLLPPRFDMLKFYDSSGYVTLKFHAKTKIFNAFQSMKKH